MSDSRIHTIDGLDAEALDRYVAGICTPDERQRLLEAATEHPEWAALLPQLDRMRTQADTTWNVDSAWGRVQRTTGPADQPRHLLARFMSVPAPWSMSRWAVGVAVSVLVIGLASAGVMTYGRWGGSPLIQRDYVTSRGERATLHLADGTQVTLGPATHLHVKLGGRERALRLDGEALFDVVHDPSHPFVVHTAHAMIKDVGTTFGVRDYTQDSSAHVVVRSGIVTLQSSAQQRPRDVVQLGANESGVVSSQNAMPAVGPVDAGTALAWTDGWLTYQNVNVATVAADLERWYDVDITVDPVVADRRLVASFQAPTADDALHIIATALSVHVERHGRRVVISPTSSLSSQRSS